MKKLLLEIELVPSTSWYNNVRSIVTKEQWTFLRNYICSSVYDICEICNDPKDKLDCHEIWNYDDVNNVQRLDGLIALCKDCHAVKHFGLALVQGRDGPSLLHLMKVNKISKKEAEEHISNAFKIWDERSKHEWKLDISILKIYNISVV